jgi:hypothetical protein
MKYANSPDKDKTGITGSGLYLPSNLSFARLIVAAR